MNDEAWHRYFVVNRDRVRPSIPTTPPRMALELRRALARSIEMFRVGETGEGRIVNDVRRCGGLWTGALCEALALYIAEEGEHARVLGDIGRALGGAQSVRRETARHRLGTRGFVVARRAAGVDTKMTVLFAAEVVGIVFYELVASSLAPSAMREALSRIAADERAHLLFQRDYFEELARRSRVPAARAVYTGIVVAVTSGVVAAFTAMHGDTLALLGVSKAEVMRRALGVLGDLDAEPEGPPAHEAPRDLVSSMPAY
ncbi:MAG: hypothetical protein U0271_11760 [Polyangiaceae bacterium]